MDNLLIDLNEFEKSLNHAENHLIAKVNSVSSIVNILVDLDLCICTDNIASLVPKSHKIFVAMIITSSVCFAGIIHHHIVLCYLLIVLRLPCIL